MDSTDLYLCDEDSYLFESNDYDSYDEDDCLFKSNDYDLHVEVYATANDDLSSSRYKKTGIQPDIDDKDEKVLDIELHNENGHSSKFKFHSGRVSSIRESVLQCKKVLASIVEKDYKDVLNVFNNGSKKFSPPQIFAAMCLHHVSSLSYTEKLKINNVLNNLQEYIEQNTTKSINEIYLDLFFRNSCPKRCYDLINRIWNSYFNMENELKYSFCQKILESESPRNKQFICNNIQNLAELWNADYIGKRDSLLLLKLLHCAVTSDQIEDLEFVKPIIAKNIDYRDVFIVFWSYIQKCNTARLLSLSRLIDALDVILRSDPQRKLWLLSVHLGVLLEQKHFEEFEETIIHYRHILLSDICNVDILFPSTDDTATYEHSFLTVLLYLLYFLEKKPNQYNSKEPALSKVTRDINCRGLVAAFKNYIIKCNAVRLFSLSKLNDTLDVILRSEPQRKLWLLCLHLSVLLELKHFEEFKETIIYYRHILLSDICNLTFRYLKFSTTDDSSIYRHFFFTVLLYLLYFCITPNQYKSTYVASKISVLLTENAGDAKASVKFFFSHLTQLHDENAQHTLIFTEVLLQIWEEKNDLKMAVIHAYVAYLKKSKNSELHRTFLQYHIQCLSSTKYLSRSKQNIITELEIYFFILHYDSKFIKINCSNLIIEKRHFSRSFRKYVSHCDESQIKVSDTITDLGIILKSEPFIVVDAILIYGTELIKRKCFEQYRMLVVTHSILLISKFKEIMHTNAYPVRICFLTLLNLLPTYGEDLIAACVIYFESGIVDIFRYYLSICDKEYFVRTKLSLLNIWKRISDSIRKFNCLVILWKKISESGLKDQYRDFIVDNKHLILSKNFVALDSRFNYKTEYCGLLSHLLHEFTISNNERDMHLTLIEIIGFKHNMLNEFKESQNSKSNELDKEEEVFRQSNSRYRMSDVLNGNLELHEYVRAVIDKFRFQDLKGNAFKVFSYYLRNLNTVKQKRGLFGLIGLIACASYVLEEKKHLNASNRKGKILSVIFDLLYNFQFLKHEVDQTKLALFLLDLNIKCKSDLVDKVTVEAGNMLNWNTLVPQSITSQENIIIYKCFCIVRQTKKTGRLTETNLEEYTSYFDFIEMLDKEEQQQRKIKQTLLLLILLLLLTSITSDGHHKSAKLKKYLSLKYAYDDLVLYLLWCSGDVEINPGPTFSKMRSMHASEKERKWICEVCSVLVKLLKELPETSKPKTLWKEKPTCWPTDEPFFDPYNKSKVQTDDLLSDESLLKCLMSCCDKKRKCIAEPYQNEINLFVNDNKPLLFETYIFRKEKHNICEALFNLFMCKDQGKKINQYTKNCGITLNFDLTQTSQNLTKIKRKGEIITHTRRDLAVILCKIIKGLIITDKCDGIWKTSPSKWPSDEPFYSPHNGKKKQGVCPDNELVDNLIKYCESNLVVIPSQFQGMVTAWKKGHMDELITIHTIYANVAKLEHSLQYLQIEGILPKPDILDFLKDNGLTLDTDTWKLNDRTKDRNHTAGRKHIERLVGNPSTSEDTASMKSSSCNERNTELQNLDISQQRAELYQNTLLPSTATSKTVDAEPFSLESSSRRKKQPKLGRSEEHNSQKRKSNTETYDGEEHEETKKQKMNNCLSEILPSTQEEEDKLKQKLNEPVPPMSEASKKCCPPDFDNILNSLLNCKDLENSINVDVY